MKLKAVLSATILGAFFITSASGCSLTDFSSESMLRPPKTTGDEAEIEQLISDCAEKGYTLKYPKNGNYRSAIIMNDLNGDKTDEAIAFFREKDDVTKIHMLVMYNDNDEWKLSSDYITETTDIDCVDFSDVNGSGSLEILVGYATYTPNINFMSCYTYEKGTTSEIKSGQNYSSFYCGDFNSDSKNEIMMLSLFTTEAEARATMLEYNKDNNSLYAKATVVMDPNVVKYKNITISDLGENTKGIVVDGIFASEELCTQIIYFNKELSLLRNPLYKEKTKNATQRSCSVISADTDEDMIVEIPSSSKLPYPKNEPVDTVADKLVWNTFSVQNESLSIKSNLIANYKQGYTLKMPDKWLKNTVTATLTLDGSVMSVYEWNKTKLGNKLFEIKVFNTTDWDSGKDNENYTLIYKDNIYAYTFINSNTESQYSITDDEIKTAFSVLNQSAV